MVDLYDEAKAMSADERLRLLAVGVVIITVVCLILSLVPLLELPFASLSVADLAVGALAPGQWSSVRVTTLLSIVSLLFAMSVGVWVLARRHAPAALVVTSAGVAVLAGTWVAFLIVMGQ